MSKNDKQCGLTVKLTPDAIEIKLPVAVLSACVEYHPTLSDCGAKLTDPQKFAEEVLNELTREDETGANMVHLMFDAAMLEAYEQGAEGIEGPDD